MTEPWAVAHFRANPTHTTLRTLHAPDVCLTCGETSEVAKVRLPPPSEVCSCGNRFDADNLCMLSACEQET